ncbi:PPE domain-containing protein [Glycomyces rhizosphaerae]|uniref:PPE domain-containing protein n=1 Tax=Glycomyces rhizosphaerae TaxID=2054422 RepID=A0ABV7Q168_9ACTN
MSMGESVYSTGAAMSPYYNGVIKSCAIAIAPPALVFGLSAQMLAVKIYMNQCNPGDMFKAAGAWIRLGEKNWEASENLTAEVDTITDENWSGDDSEAFKSSASGVNAQLKELAVTAFLIGAQLILLGIALTVYWGFLVYCTVIMACCLASYLATCWTGVGEPAARAAALATAAGLLATAETFEAALKPIMIACTALTGTLTAFTWGFQAGAGNKANPLEIAGASVANMLEGFATYWIRKVTMPAGKYASGINPENTIQAVSGIFPTYQGDGEWKSGFQGGGAGLGIADSLSNLWQDHAPEELTNPEEIQWK